MKDNIIRVGDLVAVTKPAPCCGSAECLGKVFRVGEICSTEGPSLCCGVFGEEVCAYPAGDDSVGFELRTLTKIRPLDDEDVVKDEEEVTA